MQLLRKPALLYKSACASKVFFSESTASLKETLASIIPEQVEVIKKLRKEHGSKKIGEIELNMMYGGMRGMVGLICETSVLDKDEGIRFRGLSIPELQEALPKANCEPLPEGVFWLLCTGSVPTKQQVQQLSTEWAARGNLPDYVSEAIKSLPPELHPMSKFSIGLLALQKDSLFAKAIAEGVPKPEYWEHCYEDCMNIIAKSTSLAALIYNQTYRGEEGCLDINASLDWAANFNKMMDFEDTAFDELMRLYLTIHCDHEGGNVSAHTTKLVGSALSDPYLAYASGINGLAGPLHGLANQEVLKFLATIKENLCEDILCKEKVEEFVKEYMESGRVIPGYGHAVLRKTDPRFTCQKAFGNKHLPDDEMYKLVDVLFQVVPPILEATGKVQNPWPNVDAHSGVLLQYYGMKEMNFYTVLFGVSRGLGVLASLIWDRALGLPIERPKSASTCCLRKMAHKLWEKPCS